MVPCEAYKPAVGGVQGDVVPAAGAADFDLVDDFVAFGGERRGD